MDPMGLHATVYSGGVSPGHNSPIGCPVASRLNGLPGIAHRESSWVGPHPREHCSDPPVTGLNSAGGPPHDRSWRPRVAARDSRTRRSLSRRRSLHDSVTTCTTVRRLRPLSGAAAPGLTSMCSGAGHVTDPTPTVVGARITGQGPLQTKQSSIVSFRKIII